MHRTAAAIAAALTLAGGCGDGGSETGDAGGGAPVAGETGAGHVHGVGINPADDSVVVATHAGLFRAAAGERRPRRIGDSHQDTMGFTVIGPDRFLGSGHPDLRDDLPPLLGLIESRDGGHSWAPIAIPGEADFHVLRAAPPHVYGIDAQTGALFVSGDTGRTLERRRPPPGVIDLAIDPADGERVVAATEQGLFVSADGGRGWRPTGAAEVGLLAWTDRLVLIDAEGVVHHGGADTRSFERVGSLGGQPAALSAHEGDLLAATHDNVVHRSGDGGRTWQTVASL